MMNRASLFRGVALSAAGLAVAAALGPRGVQAASDDDDRGGPSTPIRHVIVIFQENV